MPELEANGCAIHWERHGSGDPVLMIMGLGGSSPHWGSRFVEAMSSRFELILLDNRGMGQSGRADRPFTIADMAADAAAVLSEAGHARAHVVGISMGGMIAQELALDRPEMVRGLVLGCTYPGGEGSRLTDPDVAGRMFEAGRSRDRAGAVRTLWELNVSERFAADASAWEEFERIGLTVPSPLPVQVLQIQAISGHDALDRLGGIDAPTFVVHGSEDRILPPSNAPLIAERIPNARLELLDGVGHLFFWEDPEGSARTIGDFLIATEEHAGAR